MNRYSRRVFALVSLLGWFLTTAACEDTAKVSSAKAIEHAQHLAKVASSDVEEVRRGLPEGAKRLAAAFVPGSDPLNDPELARQALETARGKVQDLRVAKASFFALLQLNGVVVRSDLEQDLMASKNMISAFPPLHEAATGKYVETIGVMPEARGVEGKPDGQWVAAQGVQGPNGVLGIYAAGWAWSIYARRLEIALRSHILDTDKGGKEPLFYVFVVADGKAYGTAASPEVNAQAIEKLQPSQWVQGEQGASKELEITGRAFGLALVPVTALGKGVMVAVLRSET
jgi:hypothetical protein